jgi:hypothetical protein
MKYVIIFYLLLYSGICHSQLKIRTNITNPSGTELLVKLSYLNTTNEDKVIFLQNWRVIPVLLDDVSLLSFPQDSKLINFIFITKDSVKAQKKLSPLDWSVRWDSIPTGSFKIIKPGREFEVALSFNDLILVNALKEEHALNICFLYSVAELRKVKRFLDRSKASNMIYNGESLVILEPSVNHEHTTNPAKNNLKQFYNVIGQLTSIDYSECNERFKRQVYCQ